MCLHAGQPHWGGCTTEVQRHVAVLDLSMKLGPAASVVHHVRRFDQLVAECEAKPADSTLVGTLMRGPPARPGQNGGSQPRRRRQRGAA